MLHNEVGIRRKQAVEPVGAQVKRSGTEVVLLTGQADPEKDPGDAAPGRRQARLEKQDMNAQSSAKAHQRGVW